MDRGNASLLLLLAVALAGCKPIGPRPLRRDQPHHLVLGAVEATEARFLAVDLSKSPPAFAPVVTVPDAVTLEDAREVDAQEPLATHVGAELFVVTRRGGDAEVLRIQPDGKRSRLHTSLRLFTSRLTPRPLRVVGQRLFLVTKEEILSTRLDDPSPSLESLDTSGFDHFATLTGELVTSHDLRIGDPFDWQLFRLQGSGSLDPVGRLAHALLEDVVAVDGEDGANDGLLFVKGRGIRSIFRTRGKRVAEPEAVLDEEKGSVRALAVLGNELLLCGDLLSAVPVAFDGSTDPRGVQELPCNDVAKRGPAAWALVGANPQKLVRLETDGSGQARAVASYPVPGTATWHSILR
ncbi:MAG TPA: hypothetical protein VGK67_21395 [Myxococcales bacterium]